MKKFKEGDWVLLDDFYQSLLADIGGPRKEKRKRPRKITGITYKNDPDRSRKQYLTLETDKTNPGFNKANRYRLATPEEIEGELLKRLFDPI